MVRSMITFKCSEGEMDARKTGSMGGDAIDGGDHICAGLPENGEDDGPLPAGQAQVASIFQRIYDLRHVL